ncbi:MAG: PA14 domain-containing protein [Gemmataceae bacterium]
MAQVSLPWRQAESGNVPAVCMVCGDPATRVRFDPIASPKGIVPVPIQGMLTPYCDMHERAARRPFLIKSAGAVVLGLLIAAIFLWLPESERAQEIYIRGNWKWWLPLGGAVAIATFVLSKLAARDCLEWHSDGEKTVLVRGVSPKFVDALHAHNGPGAADLLASPEEPRCRLWVDFAQLVRGLPPACVRCGAPATTTIPKYLRMSQVTTGRIGPDLANYMTANQVLVRFPLCDAHHGHFGWKTLMLCVLLPLAPLFLFTGCAIGLKISMMGGFVVAGMFLLTWLAVFYFIDKWFVHAGLVGYGFLILHQVSWRFVKALRQSEPHSPSQPEIPMLELAGTLPEVSPPQSHQLAESLPMVIPVEGKTSPPAPLPTATQAEPPAPRSQIRSASTKPETTPFDPPRSLQSAVFDPPADWISSTPPTRLPRPGLRRPLVYWGAAVAAFLVCVCVGVGFWFHGSNTPPDPPVEQTQPKLLPGLVAEFYAGENLNRKVATRIDTRIDFDWGWDPPAPKVPRDHFSASWKGYLKPPRPGRYALITESDDGIRLYLNGKLLIDHWTPNSAAGTQSAIVELTDRPHQLRIDYVEGAGFAVVRFLWKKPGMFNPEIVPPSALLHDPATSASDPSPKN